MIQNTEGKDQGPMTVTGVDQGKEGDLIHEKEGIFCTVLIF